MSRRPPHATHAMPEPGFTLTPCCGILPTELPRYHQVSPDLRDVTCHVHGRGIPHPVRDLVEIVLTSARRPRPSAGRPFLPHGGDDGHIQDSRCALCASDVRVLVAAITEALVAAFPAADVAHLRPIRGRGPRPRGHGRSPLGNLLAQVLTTTRIPGSPDEAKAQPHGGAEGHVYDRRCALCAGDVRTLATGVEDALTACLPTVVPRTRRARRPAAEPVDVSA